MARTIGPCRSLLTIWLVSDSTVRRSLSEQPAQTALSLGQLGGPDRLGVLTQRRDRGHDVERCLPVPEPRSLGSDDRLRPLGLAAAAGEALRDDRLQVVDVVEEAPLELGDGRFDVARNGQVDQEQRSTPPGRDSPLNLVARDHEPGRARRRDHHVGARELALDLVQRERLAAEPLRELGGPIRRSIGDERDLGAARDQVAGCQLSHLARAHDQDPPALEVAEDLLRERGRGGGHRCGALADRGLDAGLASRVERAPEQAVQHRPTGTGLVGRADLAEDLALAWDHRVEPRRDAEEVQGGRLIGQPVQVRREIALREAGESRHRSLVPVDALGRDEVELGAVTGRQTSRLQADPGQLVRQRRRVRSVQRHALAHLDGRELVGGADESELHDRCVTRRPSGAARTRAKPASWR